MLYRTLPVCLTALALALFIGASAPADEPIKGAGVQTAPQGDTHQGTVVSVTADKLTMKGKARDGQEAVAHTHTLAPTAKVTCDGRACKLEDLKQGQQIRVTTQGGDRTTATRVEALDRNTQFEQRDGKDGETKRDGQDRR